MNEKNDDYLCSTYPLLYVQRNLPMKQTCMCWGFSCGDGWFWLINKLSAKLEAVNQKIKDDSEIPEEEKWYISASQVKEKFGTLRFYTSGYPAKYEDEIRTALSEAVQKSCRTCEDCGRRGRMTNYGWMRTLCIKCEKKLKFHYRKQRLQYLREQREKKRSSPTKI